MNAEIERSMVDAFIRPAKRERWSELLWKPDGRLKLRASLAHFKDLDPSVVVSVSPDQQHPDLLAKLLTEMGAPRDCYLISENSKWDATQMTLREALSHVVGYGYGTLIC